MTNLDQGQWALILSGLCMLLLIWQNFRIMKLDRLRKEFFSSGMKKDFEQVLVDQNRGITKINQELDEHSDSLKQLYQSNLSNYQKIGFVRFNPFDDAGGNISFALALLNGHGDGVVVSSLHGREGTRVYAKSIKAGVSESKLTEEETKAIKEAK